jgi:hypothetical protein
MQIDPQRASSLAAALTAIVSRITRPSVRLVAVSKLKPATDILALHSAPLHHLHFGENYLQELEQKADLLPRTVRWHFIGALQTNKCVSLAQIPNLWVVSSVDTVKKADALERGRARMLAENAQREGLEEQDGGKLGVHVQVNTSGEEEKSGCEPEKTAALCRHVREKCPNLKLRGLMTIGAIARSKQAAAGSTEANEDFVTLRRVRNAVVEELGLGPEGLELSMGMSEDFENAIAAGSDEVRVGSTIFGQRPPKSEARVLEEAEAGQG